MLRKYKKSHLIINIVLSLLLVFMVLNILIFKNASYEFLIATILIPTILLIAIFGYEKKSRRFKYELAFYVFFYSALFLVVTYIIGLFTGFTSNVYRLNSTGIIHNVIPYLLLIIVSEVLRYDISRKGDGSTLSYVLVTLILILVDLSLFITTYDLSTGDGQIKYICAVIMPSLFKNIALLYFTKRGGMLSTLIYRILLDLKLVVVPIFPNFGIYFDSIIYTLLPAIMMLIIHFQLKAYKVEENDTTISKKSLLVRYIIMFTILSMVLFVNILVSNVFKYSMIAIGSGSMTPKINKGDAIVYKRLDKKTEPEIGQILVFKKDDKMIVHRIIEIVDIGNNEKVYYTKGDANDSPDGYPIERKSALGIVKYRIRYIGIPSVMLGELFNK